MQIIKLCLLTAIVFLRVVNILAFTPVHNLQTVHETTEDTWVQEHYATVLNILMPSGEIPLNQFPNDVKWSVTIRILPPFDRPEYRFSMQRFFNGKVEVFVTKPKGGSIAAQLQTLRSKYPDETAQTIAGFISVNKFTITQKEKPQLARLAKQFEEIRMCPALPDEMGVDDTHYDFWSQSLWGNRMSAALGGPGSDARKQTHPLLEWAESVRSAIEN